MAFRRFRNFKRPFGRSRFRSRMKEAKAPQKWEWSNFHTNTLEQMPAFGDTLVVRWTRLASTRALGDMTPGTGLAINEALRSMDIGGIVMDWDCRKVSDVSYEGDGLEGRLFTFNALIVERLDTGGGPVSVATFDPFLNGVPVATVSAAGATPVSPTGDQQKPLRILWQRRQCLEMNPRSLTNTNENTLYFEDDTHVVLPKQTLNKKLRLRLDDTVGLFHVAAYKTAVNWVPGVVIPQVNTWFGGTIYYRARF